MRAWAVGVAAGLGGVGCTPEPSGLDDGVQARKLTPQEKAIEVGKKFPDVRPGMTKDEVEAILGPDIDYTPRSGNPRYHPDRGVARTTYYASPPDLPPGRHLMTAEYDITGPVPRFTRFSGPHKPNLGRPPEPPPDDK
jgi:hypothetical protein